MWSDDFEKRCEEQNQVNIWDGALQREETVGPKTSRQEHPCWRNSQEAR